MDKKLITEEVVINGKTYTMTSEAAPEGPLPKLEVPRCEVCQKALFQPEQIRLKVCGRKCGSVFRGEKPEDGRKSPNKRSYVRTLNSARNAIIARDAVRMDLVSQNYNVFQACTPDCQADFIVPLSSDSAIEIEVRCGYKHPRTGRISCNRPAKANRPDGICYAMVVEGQIIYDPPLPRIVPLRSEFVRIEEKG
jgi:hypothetical protein